MSKVTRSNVKFSPAALGGRGGEEGEGRGEERRGGDTNKK